MRKLVLWGHTLDEYQDMFNLSETDTTTRILEFGCGPSAVNVELTARSQSIVSCDSFFNFDKDTLFHKINSIFADTSARIKRDEPKFNFDRYGSAEALFNQRRNGLARFFADYEKGKQEKRYLGITTCDLPFPDFSFDFALSSHYLFADLDDQDVDFHLQVIKELARVAKEVRIFPLIDRYNQPSPFLGPVLLGLQEDNFGTEVKEVAYHLQPSGNVMLRVWAQKCQI